MAPPTAAVEARKSRRFMSSFGADSTFAFAVIVGPPVLCLQLGSPVNGLADARIGPAAADVCDLAVDVGVGRLWLLLVQGDCGHDLPRLTVSALRIVEFDPRELDWVR